MDLRPYQQAAVDAVWKHLREKDTNPCVVMPTACHAKGHPILMFDGSVKPVEDIVVGDLVMGPDSAPREVLALAHGEDEMFEINPKRGESFVVNANHVLSLVSTNEGKKALYPCKQRGGEITNIAVKDYLKKAKSWKHLRKLYRVPVDFEPAAFPRQTIPPYILGLLLGDGCIKYGVEFATADPELADIFKSYAELVGCHVRTKNWRGCMHLFASGVKGAKNPIANSFRNMGLFGCDSATKFIPRQYLITTRDARLDLLAGMLDTDGYVTNKGVEYCTKSSQLAFDICFLSRSLGFYVSRKRKFSKCQTGAADWYEIVRISGALDSIPFRRNRHKEVVRPRKMKKDALRTGFDVTHIGVGEYYGFILSGDHMYVDGNFFVHHNSGKSLVLARIASDAVTLWGGRVIILAHVKELLEQNADKVRRLCPTLDVGLYSAGLDSRDTTQSVICAGIQSVYNKADKLGKFDLVVIDECFPAGTKVATPHGDIDVSDAFVGMSVFTACGVGRVEAVSVRSTDAIVRINLSNGKAIECTPNHRFFTENGWCEARALDVGARLFRREDVSAMRNAISSAPVSDFRRDDSSVRTGVGLEPARLLFAGMPMEGETEAKAAENSEVADVERDGEDRKENLSMLWGGISSEELRNEADRKKNMGKTTILFDSMCEADGKSGVRECGQSAWIYSIETEGRQRKATVEASKQNDGDPWRHGDFGTANHNDVEATNGRASLCGKTGYCDPVNDAGNRIGRGLAQGGKSSRSGQTEESCACGTRVVRIETIKLESPVPVFNLQVSGSPTYFAGGVLVHNCHMIPPDGEGMYRTFLEAEKQLSPDMRVIGLTATPYRLKGGLICKPENVLNEVCYEAGIRELIGQGYLSKITAKQGHLDANWDALHVRAGEFVAEDIEEAVNNDRAVDQSVRDMVNKAQGRKSIIVFCSSVSHCNHVAKQIAQVTGEEVGIVTGETPSMERAEILARFKREKRVNLLGEELPPLRWLCNMGVLTTGFDAPNIDCVVLLRPTKSPGLFSQMCGRGLRLSPGTGKTECLVLDYGGNIARHGPIDCITVHESDNIHRNEPEKPHAKKCPECDEMVHPAIMICPACGYEWPKRSPELEAMARNGGVLSGEPTDCDVHSVFYSVHEKKNAPPDAPRTMQVDYMEDLTHKAGSTWVCFEHPAGSYPRRKAERWWKEHCNIGAPMPMDAVDAVWLANMGALRNPISVTLAYFVGRKWPEVVADELEEARPFRMEPEPGSDFEVPPPPKQSAWDDDDNLPF